MILKNKFYYCCLLLLLSFIILFDVFALRGHADSFVLFTLLVNITFFLSLLLKAALAKPLLKIWLIFVIGLPVLFEIFYGVYILYSGHVDLQTDFLWASIRLFITILSLAALDSSLKIKRPSHLFSIGKRNEAKSKIFSLSELSIKYPKLSSLYLRSRK